MSKNSVELLAGVFGGKSKLAEVIGVSPAMITKLIKRGDVMPMHRAAIMRALPDALASRSVADQDAAAALVMQCLPPAVCSHCGQSIEGRVV